MRGSQALARPAEIPFRPGELRQDGQRLRPGRLRPRSLQVIVVSRSILRRERRVGPALPVQLQQAAAALLEWRDALQHLQAPHRER